MNLAPGDRLGHATALALDPDVWGKQMGYQSVLPNQEWLDDLVWLHHFLGAGDDQTGELHIEDRIQHLSWQLYEDREAQDRERSAHLPHSWSPMVLHDAWRLRQLDPELIDFTRLAQNRDPFPSEMPLGAEERRWRNVQRAIHRQLTQRVGSHAAYELLDRYWHDPGVRHRGARIRVEDMAKEWPLWSVVCKKAQAKLRRLIQKKQLVVEVNPSSNWLIGPMQKLSEHQIFRLTLDDDDQLARSIITTVNSDDPGVFNTSLAHEYYLLGEVLLRRGVPEGEVVSWLDWLRTNGLDYTFLRFLPDSTDKRMKKIRRAIEQTHSPIRYWFEGERRINLHSTRETSRQTTTEAPEAPGASDTDPIDDDTF